jgi:hypothetical protein
MEATAHSEVSAANDRRNRIASLNDYLRVNGIGGKIMLTRGVASLGEEMVNDIINAMREYAAWSEDNDPWGEHDFGVLTLPDSKKIFFKIDYYDARMESGSEDPSDPKKTTRVLTVMLAEEY